MRAFKKEPTFGPLLLKHEVQTAQIALSPLQDFRTSFDGNALYTVRVVIPSIDQLAHAVSDVSAWLRNSKFFEEGLIAEVRQMRRGSGDGSKMLLNQDPNLTQSAESHARGVNGIEKRRSDAGSPQLHPSSH